MRLLIREEENKGLLGFTHVGLLTGGPGGPGGPASPCRYTKSQSASQA